MFKCIICGHEGEKIKTPHRPRDKTELEIVNCPKCGHRQLYPLLSEAELKEEYDQDKTLRSTKGVQIIPNSDFETIRTKYYEWNKIHADMYWEQLQKCEKVLNVGSGYGFLENEFNNREGKKFDIEGVEIGQYRLERYVGGKVYNINFTTDQIPDAMKEQYDIVMALHVLEHLNSPVIFLSNLKPLLKETGKIIIEVPNLNSFLCELSPEYAEFFYLYEHVSYFTSNTLKLALEKAGYKNIKTYTKEIYSIENHINWIRTGKPFIKYNQMYLPDERIEFINETYKQRVGEMGKGYSLIAEGSI